MADFKRNINIAMPGYVGPLEDENPNQGPNQGTRQSPREHASPGQQPIVLDSPDAVRQLADDLLCQNQVSPALTLLEQGVANFPESVSLHQMLMELYMKSGQSEDAGQILALQALGYDEPEFLTLLGTTLIQRREYPEGIRCFREAKQNSASPGGWLYVFAEALLRTGKLAEAEAMFEHFKDSVDKPILREVRSKMLCHLAAIRIQQGQYRAATRLCLRAFETEKKAKYRVFFFLGLAEYRLGHAEDATFAFEKHAKGQPEKVAPYRFLERLAREADEDEQADAYLMKAHQILETRRLLRHEKHKLAGA